MGFQKQDRFFIRRQVLSRWWYLSTLGGETRAPQLFGEDWSNGQPKAFTFDAAEKERMKLAREAPFTLYILLSAGEGWN